MKWAIAATVALSFIATPTANAQQRVEASYASCMKTRKVSSITTSKGPKDVRKELNRLALELSCRYEDLRETRTREVTSRNNAVTRAENVFFACLKRKGFTENSWYKKYDPWLGNKGPCMKEAKDRISSRNPTTGYKEWNALNAWLDAMVMLGNLAQIYPDSVKPTVLARYIENGKLASQCLATKKWCYQE